MKLPETSNSLIFWFDANEKFINKTSNNAVLSATHRLDGNAINVVGTTRPLWVAGAVNGFPAVSFDGNSNLLFNLPYNAATVSNGKPIMLSIVASVVNGGPYALLDVGSQSQALAHVTLAAGSSPGYIIKQTDDGSYASSDFVITSTDSWTVYTVAWDGKNLSYRRNGVNQGIPISVTSGTVINNRSTTNQIALANFTPLINADLRMVGKIAEAVVYCGEYGQSLDFSIEEFLINKYLRPL